LDVDFRVLDITNDALPKADVAIIRQVLQHLSNEQILQALPRILSAYKYVILTEHLPAREGFEPNVDKPAGPDIRLGIDSGIVLRRPPFNIPFLEQKDHLPGGGVGQPDCHNGVSTQGVTRLERKQNNVDHVPQPRSRGIKASFGCVPGCENDVDSSAIQIRDMRSRLWAYIAF